MLYPLRIFLCVLCLSCLTNSISAQISIPESPHAQRYKDLITANVPTVTMPAIDIDQLQQEDIADEAAGLPPRFGKRFETDLNLETHGRWDNLPNGGRIWRLAIESPDAISINLTFDDFFMPRGGRLFVFNEDFSQILGAFSGTNNKADGRFATNLVFDEKIIIGYYEPRAARRQGRVSIDGVIHGYRNIAPPELDKFAFNRRPPASADCFIDAACPEGDPWRDQIRSVAYMIIGNGTRRCTGALVANTNGNQRLLFLTSNQCLSTNTTTYDAVSNPIVSTWVFDWNYEASICNGSVPIVSNSTTGAVVRANAAFPSNTVEKSDFALLELTESPITAGYDVYFAGWDASGTTPPGGTSIHYPNGSPKKIAIENGSLVATTSNPITGLSSSQITQWRVTDWDGGALEGSSQGSPIFDNNSGRIVGQFSGGFAECDLSNNQDNGEADYFGQFSYSWNNAGATDSRRRLKDWLNPSNSGQLSINGYGTSNNCSNPEPVACDETYNGDTNDGQNVFDFYGFGSTYSGKEYIHSFTPNTSGLAIIELKNLSANLDLFVLSSCNNTNAIASSTNIGTNAESIMVNLTAGQTYRIVVDAKGTNTVSTYDLITGCMDPCEAPLPLECGEERTTSTFGMKNYYSQHGNSGPSWTGGETVYEFTTIGGQTTINLDPNVDLDLFLLSACDPVNNQIASSTNTGVTDESIQLNLAAGTYYIMVDGFNGSAGTYTLTLNCPSEATCASPSGVIGDVMYQGDTDLGQDNINNHGAFSGWDGKELVYVYTPDESGPFEISLTNLSDDVDLFLLDACDPVNAQLASSTQSGTTNELITFDLVANADYFIIVDGFGTATSTFNLLITTPTACDAVFEIDCADLNSSFSFGVSGSTVNADNDYLYHGGNLIEEYRGGEVVYEFVADDGMVEIQLNNLTDNLDVFLLSVCEQTQNEVARSDNDGIASEQITATLTAGTYYIMIDGYEDAESDFTLLLSCERPPILVRTKVSLQGAFEGSNNLMRNDLRSKLPLTEPFSALGFQHVNGGGGETIGNPMILAGTGSNAIVDWVFVELREGGSSSILLATRSALVQRDGDVVEIDGVSPLEFPETPDDYHISVKARNHLGVMTDLPVSLSYD